MGLSISLKHSIRFYLRESNDVMRFKNTVEVWKKKKRRFGVRGVPVKKVKTLIEVTVQF